MRRALPLVFLLAVGGIAFALAYAFADSAAPVHAVLIGAASLFASLVSAFFSSSTRSLEDMGKAKLDTETLRSLQRRIDRRRRHLRNRFFLGVASGGAAVILAAILKYTPSKMLVGFGYAATISVIVICVSLVLEHEFLLKQKGELDRLADQRARDRKFREQVSGT